MPQFHGALARVGFESLVGVEALEGVEEAVALDEAHGVVGPTVGGVAQPVDGHHARVLQPSGHLRLKEEAGPTVRVIGVFGLDLFEGNLALQFLVQGDENLAKPSPGVGPQHPVASPDGGGQGAGVRLRAGRRRVAKGSAGGVAGVRVSRVAWSAGAAFTAAVPAPLHRGLSLPLARHQDAQGGKLLNAQSAHYQGLAQGARRVCPALVHRRGQRARPRPGGVARPGRRGGSRNWQEVGP